MGERKDGREEKYIWCKRGERKMGGRERRWNKLFIFLRRTDGTSWVQIVPDFVLIHLSNIFQTATLTT